MAGKVFRHELVVSKAQLNESMKIARLRLSVVDAIRIHGLDSDSGRAELHPLGESVVPVAKPPLDISP